MKIQSYGTQPDGTQLPPEEGKQGWQRMQASQETLYDNFVSKRVSNQFLKNGLPLRDVAQKFQVSHSALSRKNLSFRKA